MGFSYVQGGVMQTSSQRGYEGGARDPPPLLSTNHIHRQQRLTHQLHLHWPYLVNQLLLLITLPCTLFSDRAESVVHFAFQMPQEVLSFTAGTDEFIS